MPISSTLAFSDPGDFLFALRRCGIVQLIPAQAAGFRARLTEIRLTQLDLLAAREHVSHIANVAAPTDRVLIVFPMTYEGTHYWAERRLRFGELVIMSDARGTWRVSAPASWGAFLLSAQNLVATLRGIAGDEAHVPPSGLTLWRPRWPAFRDLIKLHRAVVRHTVREPEAPVKTEAARGLEQELLSLLVETLTDMSVIRDQFLAR